MLHEKERERKLIGNHNGLNIFSKLKSKSVLKSKKHINKASERQKERNRIWSEVTNQKITDLNFHCEWCGRLGQRTGTENFLSGHHIIKRRFRIDTYENCYISHWITCHSYIENNGIDVRIFPNKLAWENRNGNETL